MIRVDDLVRIVGVSNLNSPVTVDDLSRLIKSNILVTISSIPETMGPPMGYNYTTFNGNPVTYNGLPVIDDGRNLYVEMS